MKYNIYGLGNALVDTVIEATKEDLELLGIQKGVMTLIDDKQCETIVQILGKKIKEKACGGSAANTIIGATQYGASCFYSSKVASDESGKFYLDDLKRNGVAINEVQQLEEGDTGRCLVLVTPDADRTMCTFLGMTASFSKSDF